jgi:hypothetical protein
MAIKASTIPAQITADETTLHKTTAGQLSVLAAFNNTLLKYKTQNNTGWSITNSNTETELTTYAIPADTFTKMALIFVELDMWNNIANVANYSATFRIYVNNNLKRTIVISQMGSQNSSLTIHDSTMGIGVDATEDYTSAQTVKITCQLSSTTTSLTGKLVSYTICGC